LLKCTYQEFHILSPFTTGNRGTFIEGIQNIFIDIRNRQIYIIFIDLVLAPMNIYIGCRYSSPSVMDPWSITWTQPTDRSSTRLTHAPRDPAPRAAQSHATLRLAWLDPVHPSPSREFPTRARDRAQSICKMNELPHALL
jgi:hypothetical protein